MKMMPRCRLSRLRCSPPELSHPSTLPPGLCVVYFSYRGGVPLKLNRYTVPARGVSAEGKRETGANPVRSRHCEGECGAQNVTGESREGGTAHDDLQPGNLPYAGTGASAPDHEALVVPLSLRGSCGDKCALPRGGFFPACLLIRCRKNKGGTT